VRFGSCGLSSLVWFLTFILDKMLSGSSSLLFLILPLGMLCLSARRMALVRILFAVDTPSVGSVWDIISSTSSVNFCQFAFL